jgi:hypothetical protein
MILPAPCRRIRIHNSASVATAWPAVRAGAAPVSRANKQQTSARRRRKKGFLLFALCVKYVSLDINERYGAWHDKGPDLGLGRGSRERRICRQRCRGIEVGAGAGAALYQQGKVRRARSTRLGPGIDAAVALGATPALMVTTDAGQEHDPEKACPGLDPGWEPVFGRDHAQSKNLESDPIQLNRIRL